MLRLSNNPALDTVIKLVVVSVAMFAFVFVVMVPLYNVLCDVLGINGKTGGRYEVAASAIDESRTVKVQFVANFNEQMPWEFKPMQREMELRIGETGLAFYEAYNPTDRVVAGSASYNVAPYEAGGFFSKIDCFCLEEPVLPPGERGQIPVSLFVAREVSDDRDAKFVPVITLGYTFHEIELPEAHAALGSPDPKPVN